VGDHVGDLRSIRLADLRLVDPREQIPEALPRSRIDQILDLINLLGGGLVQLNVSVTHNAAKTSLKSFSCQEKVIHNERQLIHNLSNNQIL